MLSLEKAVQLDAVFGGIAARDRGGDVEVGVLHSSVTL